MKVGHFLNLLKNGTHFYIYDNEALRYEDDVDSKLDYEGHKAWGWGEDFYGNEDIVKIEEWDYEYDCIEIYV